MENILLYLLPAAFYMALSACCIRSKQNPRTLIASLQLLALTAHAIMLGALLFKDAGSVSFGFTAAFSLTMWLAMLIYSMESLARPLQLLLKYASLLTALSCLLPIVTTGHPQVLVLTHWAFKAHIIVAMLAYGFFTLAVFHAVLLAAAEHQLHKGALPADKKLPPLLTLEEMLFRLIATAFVFLTLTVGSGLFFSEQIFNKPLSFNHKTVFGLAAWLLFASLLLGRTLFGWRGKTAHRILLSGFFALILAYGGSRFVLEFILNRSI